MVSCRDGTTCRLASPAGFEPATCGLEIRCCYPAELRGHDRELVSQDEVHPLATGPRSHGISRALRHDSDLHGSPGGDPVDGLSATTRPRSRRRHPAGGVVALAADCASISDWRRINCSMTLPPPPLVWSGALLDEVLADTGGVVIDIFVPSA